jgi:hypothetical protein
MHDPTVMNVPITKAIRSGIHRTHENASNTTKLDVINKRTTAIDQ